MSSTKIINHLTKIFLLITLIGHSCCWTYNGTAGGADQWPFVYPNPCGGQNQSPIDIVPANASVHCPKSPFTFHNYRRVRISSELNNGHTIMLTLNYANYTEDTHPFIEGGGLSGKYYFHQMHFHWGSDDSHGSEHTFRSKPYPAELHMVHYNGKYGSYSNATAQNQSDALAVLGIFLQIGDLDSPYFMEIINHLQSVVHADQSVPMPDIPIGFMIPGHSFYRYSGSLTTPNCNEIVSWTVFSNPITLSSKQLQQFRLLIDDEGQPLVNNDRPVQPINNRTVFHCSDQLIFTSEVL